MDVCSQSVANLDGTNVAAQPLGRWLQQHVTTSPDMSETRIVGVRSGGRGRARYLKLETARADGA